MGRRRHGEHLLDLRIWHLVLPTGANELLPADQIPTGKYNPDWNRVPIISTVDVGVMVLRNSLASVANVDISALAKTAPNRTMWALGYGYYGNGAPPLVQRPTAVDEPQQQQ